MRDRLTGGDSPEVAAASARVAALSRFLHATEPHLPAERLSLARGVASHATQRLSLSHEHTVVALAGASGGGKSSLFNALAGRELSPVGVHRPTTGEAYACVWGGLEPATDLLDWLKVAPTNRFTRESPLDGDDQAAMRGLVLLDLPDFDSLDTGHATEVKRLLGLVDLVVWVVDPQKYADQVFHEQHLHGYRHHRDVTAVVLNQADLLTAADLERLLTDLRRLLAEGTLEGVFTIATSAVDAPSGLAQLQARLAEAVGTATMAARLRADVDRAVEDLAPLVGPPVAEELVDRAAEQELAGGLARVAGMTAAAEVVEASYRRRGAALTGWAPLRWAERLRRDPLRRLRAAGVAAGDAASDDVAATASATTPGSAIAGAGTVSARHVGQEAAAGLVVREVAHHASAGLPAPWPDVVAQAAWARLTELPHALDAALATVELDSGRVPPWWRVGAVAQWLAAAAAAAGLGWLLVGWLVSAAGQPWTPPLAGGVSVPALLAGGGVVTGVLLALLAQPLLRRAARRARDRVADQLQSAMMTAGREHVITPIRTVLHAYTEARESLAAARGAE